jgi:phosphoribosylformimino-5-aminoimidazole carboxamide ribotide isomerase
MVRAMIAIPAIDIRGGACVQLVGGSYSDERVRLPDPAAVARQWTDLGFSRLHVVDLDAATEVGSNDAVIDEILRNTSAAIQVGGGVRTSERVEHLLGAGAKRVVVGTRALTDSAWLATEAARFPDRLVVAADVRNGKLALRGWTATMSGDIAEIIARLDALPLAGLLVTAVDVEGRMQGPELDLMRRVAAASVHPIIASGGITTEADLRELADIGIAEAVIGMALYTGTLNARRVAQDFGT